ncbi:permease [Arcanobacterium phocisimile]|uniref:permease n=1 Tax=Arcanobacterium phocisimile TaxID=1302235 RepID=UPI001EF792AE|nr:permease [Arcanobacterium phocisimile]
MPLSITLTFLVASPLVSETAAILIGAQFGWDIAGIYILAGAVISFTVGWIFSRFNLERWVEQSVFGIKVGATVAAGHTLTWHERVDTTIRDAREIFTKVWHWILLGVGIGALIHGWVPADVVVTYAGPSNPLAVPIATLFGVPLYAKGGGIVPIAQALWDKGMPLGTVMALIMGSIALSIPEAVILRRVLKPQLLALFFGSVSAGIIIVGYLFNFIYG